MNPTTKAATLIEALPYLQRFRGQTFLIKMGGSAMENPELVRDVMRDILFLEVAGILPVIVHGGGKAISAAMAQAEIPTEFISGLRVTSAEAIRIVEDTLNNEINANLVKILNGHGGKAVSFRGTDVFQAEKLMGQDEQGNPVDIGHVGRVVHCRTDEITGALGRNLVPVISPLGHEVATGAPLNINADLAAASLACALKPVKLVYISDVPGLLRDPSQPETLIPSVCTSEIQHLIDNHTITGGMIPKVRSAMDALEAGVQKVHFIDGRKPHSLLLEIFTQSGIGTEIR